MEELAQDDGTAKSIQAIAHLLINLMGYHSTFREVDALKVSLPSFPYSCMHANLQLFIHLYFTAPMSRPCNVFIWVDQHILTLALIHRESAARRWSSQTARPAHVRQTGGCSPFWQKCSFWRTHGRCTVSCSLACSASQQNALLSSKTPSLKRYWRGRTDMLAHPYVSHFAWLLLARWK